MNRQRWQSGKVGVYEGELCTAFHLEPALRCLGTNYEIFTDRDVLSPDFGDDFAVLLFGAGHVVDSSTALGGCLGRQRIRDLVAGGCRYVGVCAGAFLALLDEPVGLGLARSKVEFLQTENSFQGFLLTKWADAQGDEFPVWFQNGPVFLRSESLGLGRFVGRQVDAESARLPQTVAPFTDFAGRPVAVASKYGLGECVLLSSHLEAGSLGLPGFVSLVSAWKLAHADQFQIEADRILTGAAREAFLDDLWELGFAEQLEQPQWRLLNRLLVEPL